MTDRCDHCDGEMDVSYPSGGDDLICERCYDRYCRPREPNESLEDYVCRHPHLTTVEEYESHHPLAEREDKPTLTSPAIEALKDGFALLETLNCSAEAYDKLERILMLALSNEKAKEAKRLAQQFSK